MCVRNRGRRPAIDPTIKDTTDTIELAYRRAETDRRPLQIYASSGKCGIKRLNEQIAALTARVQAIETHGVRKVVPPPPEPATTVFHPVEVSGFVMPSESELKLLAIIVIAKHPSFGDVSGQGFYGSREEREEDFWRQYKAAFMALGAFKRLDAPDHKKYLSFHISAVEGYLRAVDKSETLRVQPFMTAVLAHGDIPYAGLE